MSTLHALFRDFVFTPRMMVKGLKGVFFFMLVLSVSVLNGQDVHEIYRHGERKDSLSGEKYRFLSQLIQLADEIPDLEARAEKYLEIKDQLPAPSTEVQSVEANKDLYSLYRKVGLFLLGQRYNPEALELANEMLTLCGIMQHDSLRADALKIQGVCYMANEELEKAIASMKASNELYYMYKDSVNMGNNYNNMAIVYTRQLYYSLALEAYKKAITMLPATKRDGTEYVNYFNIGALHRQMNQNEKALAYLQQSLTSVGIEKDEAVKGLVYSETGHAYLQMGDYDSAIENLEHALEILDPDLHQVETAEAWLKLGKTYNAKQEFDRASVVLHKALEFFGKVEMDQSYNEILLSLAEMYQGKASYTESRFYAARAHKIAFEYKRYRLAQRANHVLMKSLISLGEMDRLEFLIDHQAELTEKVQQTDNEHALAEMQLLLEKESMARELKIKSLQLEKDKATLAHQKSEQAREQNKIILFFLIIVLVLMLVASVIIVRLRNRQLRIQTGISEEFLRAKNKAEESDRLKTAFLANVSHEIRTPLNAIVGFSSLISDKELSEEKRSQFSHIIRQNSEQLVSLVNDILDLSRLESNQMRLNRTEVRLTDLLRDVYLVFQQRLSAPGLPELRLECPEGYEDYVINTDALRLNQILRNLLDNAVKFTKEGSIVFGYQAERPDRLLFFVKDTGIGIKKENQELVFDYFRQVLPEDKQLIRGTGIGLAICKQLTLMLGGEIWVESEEGRGSDFYFRLPLLNPSP